MKPASNAEIIQDRKEAFGMFSANGMLPGCELLVALQAAGLRHVDAAKAQAAKQRHWPGTEPLSFPVFSKLCDCFSGTAIPLAQPFQAASKPHPNVHANMPPPASGAFQRFPSGFTFPQPHKQPAADRSSSAQPRGNFADSTLQGQLDTVRKERDQLSRLLRAERAKTATLEQRLALHPSAKAAVRWGREQALDDIAQRGIEACAEEAVETVAGSLRSLTRADAVRIVGDADAAKKLLAKLHPDRVQAQCAKVVLNRRFQLVNHARNMLTV
ncbi:hypothetical protein DIPPA_19721 [Diplonema papillatum]|nr:hypothetical protein DIPPA_19721 [Diplonema papillatum]